MGSTPAGSSRGRIVFALLLAGGGALGLASTTWVRAPVRGADGPSVVAVSGAVAAPGSTALAVLVLAAAVALALAGRVAARLIAAVVTAAGLAGALVALTVLRDPLPAALAAAGEVIGADHLDGEAAITVWPAAFALVGGVVALLGGWALLAGGRWPTTGRRFDTAERSGGAAGAAPTISSPPTDARAQAMDDWDAISRGEDPSDDAE